MHIYLKVSRIRGKHSHLILSIKNRKERKVYCTKHLFLSRLFMAILILLIAGIAEADTLTDGALVVNIDNNGEFNVITLNGQVIDDSSYVQAYTGSFSNGSAINIIGTTATYSAIWNDNFNVTVTSRILGPVPSVPAITNILEQVIVYTNTSASPQPLESISNIDQDLSGSGNDVVAYDVSTQSVFATDSIAVAPNTLLMAAIASTSAPGAVFGWDVDNLGGQSTSFPMDNGTGPVGPADTAMSIGFNLGTIPAGQSFTVSYRYLYSTNSTSVPPDFDFSNQPPDQIQQIPTLSEWGMIIMSLMFAGSALWMIRRRQIS